MRNDTYESVLCALQCKRRQQVAAIERARGIFCMGCWGPVGTEGRGEGGGGGRRETATRGSQGAGTDAEGGEGMDGKWRFRTGAEPVLATRGTRGRERVDSELFVTRKKALEGMCLAYVAPPPNTNDG